MLFVEIINLCCRHRMIIIMFRFNILHHTRFSLELIHGVSNLFLHILYTIYIYMYEYASAMREYECRRARICIHVKWRYKVIENTAMFTLIYTLIFLLLFVHYFFTGWMAEYNLLTFIDFDMLNAQNHKFSERQINILNSLALGV